MKELKLIKGCGRTGNFIICLLNAILYAERLKLEQVDFSGIHWSANPTINKTLLNDFFKDFIIKIKNVHTDNKDNKIELSLDKLYRSVSLNFKERMFYIQKYIKPIMKISPKILGDNDLVIHLRSGDIMAGGHMEMIQPPLEFYEKIIDSKKWDKIYVITEREPLNPIFNYLVDKYQIMQWMDDGRNKSNGFNFKKDFDYLIGATHYVPCQSSLCPFVIQVSNTIKHVYLPSFYCNKFNAPMNWWTRDLFMVKRDKNINGISFHLYNYDKYERIKPRMYEYGKEENKEILINYWSGENPVPPIQDKL